MRERMILLAAVAAVAAVSAAAGDKWRHLTVETTPGLPGNEVQFVTPSADGGVWIGTLSGLAKLKDGKVTALTGEDGKPMGLHAWCIQERGDGSCWVGHGNGAMLVDKGGRKKAQALEGYTVAPIIDVGQGKFWAIAKERRSEMNKLFAANGDTWQQVPGSEKLRVVDIFKAVDGKLWLVLDGDGILEIDPAKAMGEAAHHLQGLNVTVVAEDTRKRIWCGLWGRGVAVWDGTGWQRHLSKQKESAVLSIAQDAKQNI